MQESSRLSKWWLNTLPPLNGPLRLAYYVLLAFVILFFKDPRTVYPGNPLLAPEFIRSLPTIIYMPQGVPGLLDIWPDPRWLSVIRAITLTAWVCAAIGLFWRASAIVTAVGFFILAAAWADYDFYRGPLMAVYTLTFLCFASCDDRWTLDTHITKRWPGYWFKPPPPGSISRTGFARTLVTVVAVIMMFSPGIAKLLDGGFRWFDGATIRHHLANEDHDAFSFIRDFIAGHPTVGFGIAMFTFVGEVGAPAALLSRRLRHFYALVFTILHLGIKTLLDVNFLAWVATYILLVDWDSLLRRSKQTAPYVSTARWPLALGFGTIGVFLTVSFLRIEFWPFSFMPVYSSYNTGTFIDDIPTKDFGKAETAQRVATLCSERTWLGTNHDQHPPSYRTLWWPCPSSQTLALAFRTDVRLAGEPSCKVPIDRTTDIGGVPGQENAGVHVPWGTWLWAFHFAALQALAANPPGTIGNKIAPDNWANRFLRNLAPLVAWKAAGHSDCTRLELTYELTDGEVAIASVPLHPDAEEPQWWAGEKLKLWVDRQ